MSRVQAPSAPDYVGMFRWNPLPFQRLLKIGAPYEAKADQQVGLASSRALPALNKLCLHKSPWTNFVNKVLIFVNHACYRCGPDSYNGQPEKYAMVH